MPMKTGALGPQERIFVDRYAATGDGVYAAEKAGYAQPRQRASQNLAKPAIQAAVARDVTNRVDRMVPKLLERWERALDDRGTPIKQVTDIGKTLLPFWKAGQLGNEAKELHEMTFEELQAAILAGNARLAALQAEENTIEHEPAGVSQAEPDIFG